jgi:hypothetical protein
MSISRSSKPVFPAGVLRTREMVPVDSPALIYRMLLNLVFAWPIRHLRVPSTMSTAADTPSTLASPFNPCPACLKFLASSYAALRSWKYKIVSRIPDSKSTFGSQPRSLRAREISGRRTFGSSSGKGFLIISDFEPVICRILSAN